MGGRDVLHSFDLLNVHRICNNINKWELPSLGLTLSDFIAITAVKEYSTQSALTCLVVKDLYSEFKVVSGGGYIVQIFFIFFLFFRSL